VNNPSLVPSTSAVVRKNWMMIVMCRACRTTAPARRPQALPERTRRFAYAEVLYRNTGATLDDLREAVTTLEDAERIARRVFGGAHPITEGIEYELRDARAVLRARETPPSPSPAGSV